MKELCSSAQYDLETRRITCFLDGNECRVREDYRNCNKYQTYIAPRLSERLKVIPITSGWNFDGEI